MADELEQKLKDGVEAAKRGDRAAARLLLESVLADDPRNEMAWIWLASTVTTLGERRRCLEKVLEINPGNSRAREALARLGGSSRQRQTDEPEPALPRAGAPRPAADAGPVVRRRRGPNLRNLALVALIVVSVVGAGLILSSLGRPAEQQTSAPVFPTITPRPTDTLEPTSGPPPGVMLVTPGAGPTLPPTFTPTATETATVTFTPSPTPFPLAEFTVFFTSRGPLEPRPSLYRMRGDGSDVTFIMDNVRDVVFDRAGELVALVRDVPAVRPFEIVPEGEEGEEGAAAPDEEQAVMAIFIAPANNPAAAEEVINLGTHDAHSPTFSLDGRQIIFVSDYDGDDELWMIDLNSGIISQLTDSEGIDRDPAWSIDGRQVVFASDRGSPGFTEIYMLTFVIDETTGEGENVFTRMTNAQNSSYAPAWSPDGSRIVFISDRSGDADVYIMDADGQRPFLLTIDDRGAEDRSPSFTPDGRLVAFISNREDDTFQLYLVDLRGDTVIRLTHGDHEIHAASFRPELRFRFPGASN